MDPEFVVEGGAALSTTEHRYIDARMDAADCKIVDLVCAQYWISLGIIAFVYVLMLLLSMPQIGPWHDQWRATKVSPEPLSKV